ncbi:unnamed protein product [Danaus chrysippus]|uniref:(African queen) hypothetical protein n=1 Tax=Danaus chrysippus TaxID=151541 RepID=A0A8J2QJN0_9NEOP|nr:unnamed protein product [Danaus chrysippus]
MSHRRILSVNDIISHLEDNDDVLSADIYITPPDNYDKSDEDSGDEESSNINHLSRQQLLAQAEFRATVSSQSNLDIIESVSNEVSIDNNTHGDLSVQPPAKKKKCPATRKWRKVDIPVKTEKTSEPPHFLEHLDTPVHFFELFFDEDVFELIRSETEKNAIQKGYHNFKVTTEEIKRFIGILLLSGYNSVARYRMYWEQSVDCNFQGASTGNTHPELGVGASVVLDLISKLPPGTYSFYMDNYFTSLPLLDEIKTLGHDATGTVRANRVEKAPLKEAKDMKKMSRGSFDQCTDTLTNITLVRYNDNNIVTVASTECGVEPLAKADIAKKVKEADAYSVLADETADISGTEQLSIGLRYFDEEANEVQEMFVGFVELEGLDAKSIAYCIDEFLTKEDLNPADKCVGFGFDGCSTMSGKDDEIIRDATVVAKKVGLEEDITSMPRIVGKQRHRSNHPAESPSEFWKRSLIIPYLDSVITSLETRFAEENTPSFALSKLHPAQMQTMSVENLTENCETIAQFYNLPNIKIEVELWQQFWHNKPNSTDQTVVEKKQKPSFPTRKKR